MEKSDNNLTACAIATTLKSNSFCIDTFMPIHYLIAVLLLMIVNVGSAQTIRVACSDSVPPFVLPNSDQGIALDVLRAAMLQKNIRIIPIYGSNEQNLADFISGNVDAILVAPPDAVTHAYEGDQALMEFHNYAISLTKNDLHIDQITDLADLTIGAFSLASRILPSAFREVANQAPEYREFVNQKQQVLALLTGDVEVIVLEKMLFRYLLTQMRHQDESITRQAIRYHDLFQPTYYHTTFKSQAMAKAFNEGLSAIQANGEYQTIINTYEQLLNSYLMTP